MKFKNMRYFEESKFRRITGVRIKTFGKMVELVKKKTKKKGKKEEGQIS